MYSIEVKVKHKYTIILQTNSIEVLLYMLPGATFATF